MLRCTAIKLVNYLIKTSQTESERINLMSEGGTKPNKYPIYYSPTCSN